MFKRLRVDILIRAAGKGIHSGGRVMVFVAAITLLLMMVLTVVDVSGRYFLNAPINGVWEIMGLLMVCVGSWGLAFCQFEKGHINVTFFLEKLPRKVQRMLECISYVMGIFAFSIITWQAFLLALRYASVEGHVTDSLHIPYFPIIGTMMMGTGMLVLVLIVDLINSVREIMHR